MGRIPRTLCQRKHLSRRGTDRDIMGGDHWCRECVYYWTLPVEYDPTVWDPTHHCYRDCYQCLRVGCGELCDEGLAVVFDPGKQKQTNKGLVRKDEKSLLGGFFKNEGYVEVVKGE